MSAPIPRDASGWLLENGAMNENRAAGMFTEEPPFEGEVDVSIAISLKRLADTLDFFAAEYRETKEKGQP